jgi:hypothetical protein
MISARSAPIATRSSQRSLSGSYGLFWAGVISIFVRIVRKSWGFPTGKASGWDNREKTNDSVDIVGIDPVYKFQDQILIHPDLPSYRRLLKSKQMFYPD